MLRAMSLVALGISVALVALLGWRVGVGFAGGALLGAGMLWALVVCTNSFLVLPGQSHGPRWPYLLLHVGKFGAALALAWLVVWVFKGNVISFMLGYLVALVGYLAFGNSSCDTSARAG